MSENVRYEKINEKQVRIIKLMEVKEFVDIDELDRTIADTERRLQELRAKREKILQVLQGKE